MRPRVLMVTAEMAEFPFTRAESAKKKDKITADFIPPFFVLSKVE